MIVKDCTREVLLAAFVQKKQATANGRFFLDNYFTLERVPNSSEGVELRDYYEEAPNPLFYSGACEPPQKILPNAESVTLQTINIPTIKAEGRVDCKVNEAFRIDPLGNYRIPTEKFNVSMQKVEGAMLGSMLATFTQNAIDILKEGGCVLRSSPTDSIGTLDFKRDPRLTFDLTITDGGWAEPCSDPEENLDSILEVMSEYNAYSGELDIFFGKAAWKCAMAHDRKNAMVFDNKALVWQQMLDPAQRPLVGYNDVRLMETSNNGQWRHYRCTAKYKDHTGATVDVLKPGEILIVARNTFMGKRLWNGVSVDGAEVIPDGSPITFFAYDNLNDPDVYNRKCRAATPWIEARHLLITANANGSAFGRVCADDAEPCSNCLADCPPAP